MDRSAWQRAALGLRRGAEAYKALRRRVRSRLGWMDAPAIVAYRGFGTARRISFGGRVIERHGVVDRAPGPASKWRNVRAMLRRFQTDELPRARVRAHVGGRTFETEADEEGYFVFEVDCPRPLRAGWHDVRIDVVESLAGPEGDADVSQVLIPAEDADFAVVSDIDDTVIETYAADRLQMLRTVFLHDAHSRNPFPGVSELYRSLVAGPSGVGDNPIFYLSRSPWNLFDLFTQVFEVHALPNGPLLLRDFSLIEAPSRRMGREDHKLWWLRRLLSTYPALKFVLIGDSGQQDPEIYEQIALEHPGRIAAILIRELVAPLRDRKVRKVARELGRSGVPTFLGRSSTELAARLAGLGLIPERSVERVERRRERSLQTEESFPLIDSDPAAP